MKKVWVSVIVATVVTLTVYFGAVFFFGMESKEAATVVAFVAVAFAFNAVFAVFAVVVAAAAAVAFAFNAVFAVVAAFVFAVAAATTVAVAADQEKVKYWKVVLVYLLEAAIIFTSIYFHLNW